MVGLHRLRCIVLRPRLALAFARDPGDLPAGRHGHRPALPHSEAEFLTSTVAWAEADRGGEARARRVHLLGTFSANSTSVSGRKRKRSAARYASTEDLRLTYRGVTAQAGASHCQFLARKSVLAEFVPFVMDRPMGQVRQLDQRMNDAGYLRLMTTEPLMMNMSNSTRRCSRQPGRRGPGRPAAWPATPGRSRPVTASAHGAARRRVPPVLRRRGQSMNAAAPTLFVSADHGLALVYFLQSDVVPTLLEAGHKVVLLTDDA